MWGTANYGTNQVLSAAYFKRFSALGPGGLGQIYSTSLTGLNQLTGAGLTPNATPWLTIPNAGTNPRPAGTDWPATPSTVSYDWFHDSAAFASVDKVGLGDIDITYDQTKLYAVNLNDRQLYEVPLTAPGTAGAAPVAGAPTAIALPLSLPGAAQGCATDQVRPYGLGEFDGKMYVTLTCTGPTTADLRGYIYTMDEKTHAFSSAPVLETDLTYPRSTTIAGGTSANFQPWSDTFAATGGAPISTQPLLSNVVFNANGAISLSILDRNADQNGSQSGSPTTADAAQYNVSAAGDLLDFCGTPASGWTREVNGVCGGTTGSLSGVGWGPGSGHFYTTNFDSAPTNGTPSHAHNNVMLGSALQLPGVTTIMTTSYNPITPVYGGSGSNTGFNQAGFRVLNTSNGGFAWGGTVSALYAPVGSGAGVQTTGSFGKAGGLGDLSTLVSTAPIEIGNYVWNDTNKDGIQQAGEAAIAGVTVHLYAADGTTLLGTAVTDSTGQYIFSSGTGTSTAASIYGLTALTFNTDYVVKVDKASDYATGGPLAGLSPTQTSAGSDTLVDSNGVNTGGISIANVTTGDVGENDHSIDFGFTQPVYAVGDYVWYDTNKNGKQDAGELPVPGVTVTLYNSDGTLAKQADNTAIPTITTDSAGHYVIDNLALGTYYAVFSTLPAGSTFTTPTASGTTVANDSNPAVATGRTPNFTITPIGGANTNMRATVTSDQVTKASAIEPTIDAGIIPPAYAVGDYVWIDANNNGIQDSGETPVPNVTVALLNSDGSPATYSDGTTPVTTTTTNSAGHYVFDDLAPGSYKVQFSTLPAGYTYTTQNATGSTSANDSNPASTGLTPTFTVGPIATNPDTRATVPATDGTTIAAFINPTIDAGLTQVPTYAIGNRLWKDTGTGAAYNNGTYDATEPAVSGATVNLLDSAGTVIATTTTDAAGYYRFDGLATGSYKVQVDKSNFATGGVLATYLSSTGNDTAFLAADNNKDHGIDDAAPATNGILSSTITLTTANPTGDIDSGATGAGGHGTNPDANDNLTADFGFIQPYDLMITKAITSTGPYVPGSTVTYTLTIKNNGPATALTGFTAHDRLPAGLTYVSATGTNWGTPTVAGQDISLVYSGADLTNGASATVITVTATVNAGVASGTILTNLSYVSPSPAQPQDESIPVGNNGGYENGSNVPTPTNPSNNDDSQPITVSAVPTYSLGNRLWIDQGTATAANTNNGVYNTGEAAVPTGTVVDLLNSAGTQIASTTTDAAGYYRFDGLVAGTYTVRVDKSNFATGGTLVGYLSSTGVDTAFATADNNSDHGIDDAAPATNGILSNPVTLTASNPTGDVDSGATGNGANGPNGDASDNLTVDFGFIQPYDLMITKTVTSSAPYNVGSTVTYDLTVANNGPGTAVTGFTVTDKLPAGLTFSGAGASGTDWTCAAAAGQLITCTYTGADMVANVAALPIHITATVDAGVAAGTTLTNFSVVQPSPNQKTPETIPVGTNPDRFENGSNVPTPTNPSNNDDSKPITVTAVPTYAIGNRIWLDMGAGANTNNGTLDSGETPISGVVVNVLNSSNTVVGTSTTDANGYYRVDNLPAGTYTVQIDKSNFATGAPLAGLLSSTGNDTSFLTADNNSDHGIDATAAVELTSGIVSAPVTLSASNPTGDIDAGATGLGGHGPNTDLADNLTADFGFIAPFDLKITKTVTSAGPYTPGSTVTYSLTAHNNGPGTAVTGFTITDKLPTGLTYVSATGTSWGTPTVAGQQITLAYSGADLASGLDATPITVTATVNAGVAAGTILTNFSVVQPSPNQKTPETIPVGTTPDKFENGSNVPTPTNPSNNDDSQPITVTATPTYSLGNRLWIDQGSGTAANDNDGKYETGEAPVSGAVVQLMDSSGTNVLATTTTDANGYYRFDGLALGTYTVRIPAANFQTGGQLVGYLSSTPTDTAFAATDNNSDHGINNATPPTNGILSSPVTLTASNPTGDVDSGATGNGANGPNGDASDNLTADFGFIQPYDLMITKAVTSAGPYVPGSTVTYTLSVKNNGPGVAQTGFIANDKLPTGLTYVSAAGASWGAATVAGQQISLVYNGSDLASGSSAPVITVTATVDSGVANGTTLTNDSYVAPSPNQKQPETIPVGTTNGGYENGSNVPTPTNPSNNDDSQPITVSAVPTYAIGNRIWLDMGTGANTNNGTLDSGETPIAGVVVNVLDSTNTVVGTSTTDANGYYRVDGLPAGAYTVQIDKSNFATGAPLAGLLSSTGADSAFLVGDNNKDHGIDASAATELTNGVLSNPVTLSAANPTGDAETPLPSGNGGHGPNADAADNLTADFGFIQPFDLKITKAVTTAGPYVPGSTVTYTLTAHNNGPGIAVTGFTVTDKLPTGLTYVSATGTNWGTPTVAGQQITLAYNGSDLASGADGSVITVTATVNAGVAAGTTLTNFSVVEPSPNQKTPETIPVGTNPDKFENGSNVPTPTNPSNNDDSQPITVTAVPTYAIGNRLWFDMGTGAATNNGSYDSGEAPVAGVKVNVLDSSNIVVGTSTTDANGYYRVDNLVAGTYTVQVDKSAFATGAPLAGYLSSTGADSAFALADNNKDHGVDVSAATELTAGVLSGPVTLSASNPTGDIDAGATGLGGHGPNTDLADNLTADFGFIAPYDLMITKTVTSTGTYVPGSTVGYDLTVANNGPGAAVTGFTVTDKLPAGLTYVSATGTDWTVTNVSGQLITLTYTGADMVANVAANAIHVTATVDAGVASGTTLTNFSVVEPSPNQKTPETIPVGTNPDKFENGSNVPTPTNPSNNDDSKPITVSAVPTYAIGNRLWFDMGTGANTNDGTYESGETAVANATVNLLNSAGTVIATTTTDASGYYRFDGLLPADYKVQVDKANFATGGVLNGYLSSTGVDNTFLAADNNKDHGVDSATPATTGITSGTITLSASNPTGDVDSGATGAGGHGPNTDASDNLTADFGFIQPYDLKITKAVTSSAPYVPGSTVTYTLTAHNNGPGTALTGFTVTDKLPTGLTYVSATGANWGTPTVAGQQITLAYNGSDLASGGDASVITVTATVNAGVATGTTLTNFSVVEPSPNQKTPETIPVGTSPDKFENGSNVPTPTNPSNNDDSQPITVSAVPTYAIGNRIWLDMGTGANTNNGTLDSGETPIAGVVVNVLDSTNTVVGTSTTDANGYYRVDGLPAGAYTVQIDKSNFATGAPLAGLLSSTGADSAFLVGDNNKDHGIDASAATELTNGVLSNPVTLSAANPTGDAETPLPSGNGGHGPNADAADNLTADFGFIQPFDLKITKAVTSTGPYTVGSTVKYTLQVTNNGPGVALTGFQVHDLLPAGLSFTATPATGTNWTCAAPTGQEIVCTYTGADLAAGTSAPELVTVNATVTATSGGTYTNTSFVSPSPNQKTPETIPVGTTNGGYENGSNVPTPTNPSNNDDSQPITVNGPTYSLGNRLWFDTGAGANTNNGSYDSGETPVAGATVVLLDAANTVIGTKVTDAGGYYRFDGLAAGTYTVNVAASNFAAGGVLANYLSSTATSTSFTTADNNTDHGINATPAAELTSGVTSNIVTLSATNPTGDVDSGATGAGANGPLGDNYDNLTADFGFVPQVSLGNKIWLDNGAGTNANNGKVDSDESGVPGVAVNLVDSTNTVIGTTTTDGNGNYRFDGLAPGTYTVQIPASQFAPGAPLAGTLSSTPTSSTFGTADNNTDHGVNDTTPAVNGITSTPVTLTAANTLNDIDSGATGAGGHGPSGDAGDNLTVDLGFVPSYSLGNKLWFDTGAGTGHTDNGIFDADETPIVGATVQLLDSTSTVVGTQTTDAAGYYRFDNLTPGTYTVRVAASNFASGGVLATYVSSTPTATTFTTGTNNTDHGINSTATAAAANGVSSSPVTLSNSNPTGDVDSGATGAGAHGPAGDLADNLTVDFGFVPTYSLGNKLWFDNGGAAGTANNGVLDAGEAPVTNATVNLLNSAGTVIATTTTDAAGYYRFDGLPAGDYKVQVPASDFASGSPLAGYFSSTGVAPSFTTPTNNTDHGIDSTTPATTGITSGTVTLGAGVNPTGDVDSGTTGAGTNGPGGDAGDNLTADFGFFPGLSIGNRLWFDTGAGANTNNGKYDSDETPVKSATVNLLNAAGTVIATTTTDTSGYYRFDGLPVGDYKVQIPASDFASGAPLAGYLSSTGADTAFLTADNNTDHGVDAAAPATLGIESATVSLTGATIPTGEVDSGATGAGANGPLGDKADQLTVDFGFIAPYDLMLTKTVTTTGSPATYQIGQTATFGLTVKNNGPGTAVTGFTVSDLLPAGLTYVSATGTGWTVTTVAGQEITLTYSGADLASGASAPAITLTATVATAAAGTQTNFGVVQPSPNQKTPETIPVGTTPNKYENGSNTPTPTNPSNNDDSKPITVVGPTYSLGNRVWFDTGTGAGQTDNGTLDAGEKPVAGATVFLLDAAGNQLASTTTDANGYYRFDGLAAGVYKVQIAPSNFTTGGVLANYVSSTGVDTAFAAGDNNKDHGIDSAAPSTGGITSSTVTLGSGVLGDKDSGATGKGDNGPFGDNYDNLTADFGFVPGLSLGNKLWIDNGTGTGQADNGHFDTGELPVVGAVVNLLDSTGAVVATTTTDAAGYYRFDGLVAGDYKVGVPASQFAAGAPLAGLFSSTGVRTTFATGDNNYDHGIDVTNPKVTGVVTDTVSLTSANTLSDHDSGATGAGAQGPNGDASDNLTVDLGFVPVFAVGDYVWKDLNGNGKQDSNEPAVPGVTVTLLTPTGQSATDVFGNPIHSTTTDSNGHYVFDNVPAGSYEVQFTNPLTGYQFTTPSAPGTTSGNDSNPKTTGLTPVFTVGPSNSGDTSPVVPGDKVTNATLINRTIDAGLVPVLAVGDYVWIDANHNGIQDAGETPVKGVTVTLEIASGQPVLHADGTPVTSTTTDANGHYVFDDLLPGDYKIVFSGTPAGYVFTTQEAGTNNKVDSNPGSTGVTPVFTLSGSSADVRPVVGSDKTTKATLINPTIDAGLVPVVAVGDYVWSDVNGNGVQDKGEAPVQGVTVTIQNPNGTPVTDASGKIVKSTTTDSNGHYVFDNLLPGQYQIVFSGLPAGSTLTTPNANGSTTANDSNPNVTTGKTPVFTLAPGGADNRAVVKADQTVKALTINPTIDAGIVPPLFAVGDYVWNDVNKNGIQDLGEKPVAGVTVTLYTSAGKVVGQTSTDSNGHYVFDSLPAGQYYVVFSNLPSEYQFTFQRVVGGTDADDSNPATGTGRTPVFTLGLGQADMRLVVGSDKTTVAWMINPTIDAGIVEIGVLPDNGNTPPKTPTTPDLSYTGVPARTELSVAVLLLLVGGAFLLVARRRRDGEQDS